MEIIMKNLLRADSGPVPVQSCITGEIVARSISNKYVLMPLIALVTRAKFQNKYPNMLTRKHWNWTEAVSKSSFELGIAQEVYLSPQEQLKS